MVSGATSPSVCYELLNLSHAYTPSVPQQPELLSGTIRDNLDPFGEYDDATLNDALRSSGLNNVQVDDAEERITLDTAVSSGGGNFSLGQRQIIALARAICRQSKLLILDEGKISFLFTFRSF
jgi:ABC-type multidrug transport system fused ATPase/permease subunit